MAKKKQEYVTVEYNDNPDDREDQAVLSALKKAKAKRSKKQEKTVRESLRRFFVRRG